MNATITTSRIYFPASGNRVIGLLSRLADGSRQFLSSDGRHCWQVDLPADWDGRQEVAAHVERMEPPL